jgi:hypothetical protein
MLCINTKTPDFCHLGVKITELYPEMAKIGSNPINK